MSLLLGSLTIPFLIGVLIAVIHWRRIVFKVCLWYMGTMAYLAVGSAVPIVGYSLYGVVGGWVLHREIERDGGYTDMGPGGERRRFRREIAKTLRKGERPPKIYAVEPTDRGVRLRVILPVGESFAGLAPAEKAKREAFYGSVMECKAVGIAPDAENLRRGSILVHRRDAALSADYLADVGAWPWFEKLGQVSFLDPIPVGRDEGGKIVALEVLYRNGLLSGLPGSGKSVALSLLIAAAAQDPTVEVWGLDGGGGVDLAFWEGRFARYATSPEDAFLVMQSLKAEISRRAAILKGAGRVRWERGDEGLFAPLAVFMDEFATFTDERKRRRFSDGIPAAKDDPGETFVDATTYCMRLGRKHAVIMFGATQDLRAQVVSPKLRNLFGFSWAMRVRDVLSSNIALYPGAAGEGFNAAKLDMARPGDSFLIGESGKPRRMRSFYLSTDELKAIATAVVPSSGTLTPIVPGQGVVPSLSHAVVPSVVPADLSTSGPVVPSPPAPVVPSAMKLGPRHRQALTLGLRGASNTELAACWDSETYGRKQVAAMKRAGLLTAPRRSDPTVPEVVMTTLAGRKAIETQGDLSTNP
jgi:hypothetical protein